MVDKMDSDKRASKPTVDDWLRSQAAVVTRPLALGLARLKIHPNTITLVGFGLNAVAGLVVAKGSPRLGGVLMWVASSTDAVDGMLARVTAHESPFGAFLDSTFDRLSEGAVLIGLMAWFATHASALGVLLTALTLLGSVMVSYTRARAEGVGVECKVGLLTRPLRVFVLGVGMLTLWLVPTLVLLSVLTWFTVGQRIVHVYRVSRQQA